LIKKLLIIMTMLSHICLLTACAPQKNEPENNKEKSEEPQQEKSENNGENIELRIGDEEDDKKEKD
jgi:hypothetical protein